MFIQKTPTDNLSKLFVGVISFSAFKVNSITNYNLYHII